jgi:predicted DNA-binding transcriptional regulator AlpA
MPAPKHRDGPELEAWEARKRAHQQRLLIARETVRSLTGHTLLRLDEAAAMLGVTVKTLREQERANPKWPPRIRLSEKITGYRLKDLEALVDSGMASAGRELAE